MASVAAELGVVHGRFQVLHNDHLKYILAGKSRCRHLIVGITNPDPTLGAPAAPEKARTMPVHNPLTYFERYSLVRAALLEAGVVESELSVVPLPIDRPERIAHYAPPSAIYYLTAYDDWGREKQRRLQALGLATEMLWERPPEQKGISATHVRQLIRRGLAWEHLVPPAVARLVTAWSIADRL